MVPSVRHRTGGVQAWQPRESATLLGLLDPHPPNISIFPSEESPELVASADGVTVLVVGFLDGTFEILSTMNS